MGLSQGILLGLTPAELIVSQLACKMLPPSRNLAIMALPPFTKSHEDFLVLGREYKGT